MQNPTSTRQYSKSRTLLGLQYLRGIAAMMVAYFHMVGQIPSLSDFTTRYGISLDSLASGVDIFFVISGFIMLLTTVKSRPLDFVVRRIIRVAPLYWLLTICIALMATWKPDLFRTTVISATSLILSLLFIPYPNAAHGGEIFPILVPGWSLNFEMFFYVIFAMVLLCGSVTGRVVINGLIFAVLLVLHYTVLRGDGGALGFLTDIRIVEFWLGMLIARWYLKQTFAGQRPRRWWIIIFLAFVLLIFHPDSDFRGFHALTTVVFTILPAAIVVLGVAVLEQVAAVPYSSFLNLLGNASYSIYLAHIFLLGVVREFWLRFGLPVTSLQAAFAFSITSMAVVIMGSLGVYYCLEKPITSFLHRQHMRRLVLT